LTSFPFAKDKLLALRVGMAVENGAALVEAIVEKIQRVRERVRRCRVAESAFCYGTVRPHF
jgi:hypothetical protein